MVIDGKFYIPWLLLLMLNTKYHGYCVFVWHMVILLTGYKY